MAAKATSRPTQEPELRDIPGFPGHRSDSEGGIWNCWKTKGGNVRREDGPKSVMSDRWRKLKPAVAQSSRRSFVSVKREDGQRKTVCVARLVYAAFKGVIPEGLFVWHINGDHTDDRLVNLRLGTMLDVQRNRRHTGHDSLGQKHGNAKLTDTKVRQLWRLHHRGLKGTAIARRFGVSKFTVSGILNRRTWRHIEDPCQPAEGSADPGNTRATQSHAGRGTRQTSHQPLRPHARGTAATLRRHGGGRVVKVFRSKNVFPPKKQLIQTLGDQDRTVWRMTT